MSTCHRFRGVDRRLANRILAILGGEELRLHFKGRLRRLRLRPTRKRADGNEQQQNQRRYHAPGTSRPRSGSAHTLDCRVAWRHAKARDEADRRPVAKERVTSGCGVRTGRNATRIYRGYGVGSISQGGEIDHRVGLGGCAGEVQYGCRSEKLPVAAYKPASHMGTSRTAGTTIALGGVNLAVKERGRIADRARMFCPLGNPRRPGVLFTSP